MDDFITKDFFCTTCEVNTRYLSFERLRIDASFLEALRGRPVVTSIAFHCCEGLQDSNLDCLATLPRLRQLYCCDSNLTGSCLKFLKNTPLTYLDFTHSSFLKENRGYLRNFTELEHLSLKDAGVDETIFSELTSASCLKELDLSFNKFNDEDELLSDLPALKEFHAICSPGASNFVPYVAKMPALRTLHLGDSNICDKDLESLSSSSLANLILTLNQEITDEALKYIRDLPNLRFLFLGGASITADGLEILADSPAAKSLFCLELRGIKNFYPDVKFLRKDRFPQLHTLEIDYSEELEAELLKSGYEPDESGDPIRYLKSGARDNQPDYFLYTDELEKDFHQIYHKAAPERMDDDLNWSYSL